MCNFNNASWVVTIQNLADDKNFIFQLPCKLFVIKLKTAIISYTMLERNCNRIWSS